MNRDTASELSVLLVTHNDQATIKSSLDSILAQDLDEKFPIVVADQGSTDDTLRIIADSAGSDRITLKLDSVAKVLEEIDSEFVALCWGNDLWSDSQKLRTQLRFMHENSEVALSHHACAVENFTGNSANTGVLAQLELPEPVQSLMMTAEQFADSYIMRSSALIRRDAVRDEFLRAIKDADPQDLLIFAGLVESGLVGFVPGIRGVYRAKHVFGWAVPSDQDAPDTYTQALWLLSAVLVGPSQSAFQSRLIAWLLEDGERQPSSLAEMTGHGSNLEAGMAQIREQFYDLRESNESLSIERDQLRAQNIRLRDKLTKARRLAQAPLTQRKR